MHHAPVPRKSAVPQRSRDCAHVLRGPFLPCAVLAASRGPYGSICYCCLPHLLLPIVLLPVPVLPSYGLAFEEAMAHKNVRTLMTLPTRRSDTTQHPPTHRSRQVFSQPIHRGTVISKKVTAPPDLCGRWCLRIVCSLS